MSVLTPRTLELLHHLEPARENIQCACFVVPSGVRNHGALHSRIWTVQRDTLQGTELSFLLLLTRRRSTVTLVPQL